MSGQIRLRRRSANVRKFKALLKIGGADQYSMRHTLGQLNDSWRRRKACDSAAPKSSCSFGSTSYLQYWNIFDGLKAQSFDQNPRGNIRGASHTTDADAFTSQIFRRLDRFLNHQLVRQRIEKARDHDEIRAPDSGAGYSTSGRVADGDIAGDDTCDGGGRAGYENELAIQSILFEKADFLRHIPRCI